MSLLKSLFFLGLIGLAISLPLLFSKTDPQDKFQAISFFDSGPVNNGEPNPYLLAPASVGKNRLKSPFQFASSSKTPTNGPNPPTSSRPPVIYAPAVNPHQPVYTPAQGLGEIFRFEVAPNWISSRWPRVSICPGEDNLTGMRVPLVTGPSPRDLHGSLTYFFDNQQQLQRITFKGWTGDATNLVSLVTNQFGFRAQGSKLYLKSSWGKNQGALRLDQPPVVRNDMPTEQLMVLLEINHPSGKYKLSDQISGILKAMN